MTGARRSAPVSTADDALQYDAIVVPRYSGLFAQLIVDELPQGARATVLDIGCGSGTPAFEIVRRLGEGGRVIAVDPDQALVDLARRRASVDPDGRRLFFKCETADELRFGDEVFDFVVGNLVLGSLDGPASLPEMRRVLVRGGRLLLTQAMSGTFEEALDVLREIATRGELKHVAARAETVAARYPTHAELRRLAETTGFEGVQLREESFRLSFRSPRDLFVDPLLRLIGIPEWRWIAGFEPGGEKLLEQMERTLETYFGGGPLSLTVNAGLLSAHRGA
jgi:ubiquinone/menaquinone biosynthesis C-methylase UbiE